jgi:Raf kinase inhibitor-like YbhB/YbcL family protein
MNFLIPIKMSIIINTILSVTSPAFKHNGSIPAKYTCDGSNINPELIIGDLPADTKSLALIMEDPDAPGGTYVHWIMWNIPPVKKIEEKSSQGTQGKNERNENKYYGPCPPGGMHHYHFRVYALDAKLELPAETNKSALLKAMEEHIIGSGELTGTYGKKVE